MALDKPRGAGGRGNLFVSTIALNFLSLALPVMTLQVYDRILPNPDSGTLPVLIAGVTVAVFLEACLRLSRAWMMGWNGAVYEHQLSTQAMRRVLSTDTFRTKKSGIGEFLHRMTAIGRVKDFHSGYVLVTLAETAFVPVFLGAIFYIAQPLFFIPLSLLLLFIAISAFQGQRMQKAMEGRDLADDKRYNFLIECLKGIHSVKSFALENLLSRRYEGLQESSSLASFRSAEASTSSFNAGTLLSHVMMAAVITAGAIFVLSGHITTGALVATLLLSGRLMQPAQRALMLWTRFQEFRLSRRKIEALFAVEAHNDAPATELPPVEGRIDIKGAHLKGMLKDVSLEVAPGEAVSIYGPLGCGKTALLEMIAGLYPPDDGRILIDGLDACRYPPEELSRRVGYLATEGITFRGTIRDNLTRFGLVSEKDAQEAARLLHVDRDVARLAAGFDTPLQISGNDGVPPGLRQRIALARVLAARPKIILFDEADRALDRQGYNLLFSLLSRLSQKTALVLVSDDANITSLAQRHYLLARGRLIEKSQRPERKASP